MRSVIEYPEFVKNAVKEFGEKGREEIVSLLSQNPKAGKKMEGFGGIRRLDWHQTGRRNHEYKVYFHPGNKNLPIAVISMFKKGEKLIMEKLIEILIHSKNMEIDY